MQNSPGLDVESVKRLMEWEGYSTEPHNLLEGVERENFLQMEKPSPEGNPELDIEKGNSKDVLSGTSKQGNQLPDTPLTTAEKQRIIRDRVENGKYSLRHSYQGYLKHVEGSPQYNKYLGDRLRVGKGAQSRLTITKEEAEAIIKKYYGTGTPRNAEAGGGDVEFVTVDRVVGFYYADHEWHPTKRIAIHYKKSGSHIVPVKEDFDG